MRKFISIIVVLGGLIPMLAYGQSNESYIFPTVPGTQFQDYSQPGWVVGPSTIQPTLPGTRIQDYSRPGYVVDKQMIYPTIPGTNFRDYSRPGYKIE